MARSMLDEAEAEAFNLAASASHLLHRVEQIAAERFEHLVGDTLTLRQFAMLAAVASNPGQSQSDLARTTGIDRSTLAEMISRLERRGWIDRTTSLLDARAYAVRLSTAGADVLAAATRHARAADAAILDALPRTKRRSLLTILEKLVKAADEATAKAERTARRKSKREAKTRSNAKKKQRQEPRRKHRV